MPKDTKSLDNNKAPACESRGFVHKKKKACILTHLLFLINIIFAHCLVVEKHINYNN